MIRKRVHYSGHVQGVGFRATTAQIARGFQVDGTVRNLPDGDVLLVAQGAPREVDAFLAAVADAMSELIHRADEEILPPIEQLGVFRIEY